MRAAEVMIIDEIVTFSDVSTLAHAGRPCITAVVSIPNPRETAARFKNAIRDIEKKLVETGHEADVPELTGPVRDLAVRAEAAGFWANSMVLYRSPELFRSFVLLEPAKEMITVEERFQIRPLLAALAREQQFNLLCLSRRNIRLFHCTHHRAEEVAIPESVPRDLRTWMGTWKPDHVRNNRAVVGPSIGSAKGVPFTTSRDREREDEYLAHFLADVNRGIAPLLRDGAPLVLAGVEEEVTIYRRVNSYPRLVEKAVEGSPDSMEDHVLHQRARDIIREEPSEQLAKSLAHFERYRDSARVSSDAEQIVPAAWEGRVSDLVFSRNAELRGFCMKESGRVEKRDDGEDLLNAAALQAVLHKGQAFAIRDDEMPVAAQMAAVFRY